MQTPIVPTQRVFLALWPDDRVREQIAAHADQWTWGPGCLRYLPADWHVTLHFIGNVSAERLIQISVNASVPFQPFELVMDQTSLWPRGLAVLGATKASKPLLALHDQLGHALLGLGLTVATRP